MREREMLKVTKCVRVNSFVEALINMVCEPKNTSWSKKNCLNNYCYFKTMEKIQRNRDLLLSKFEIKYRLHD